MKISYAKMTRSLTVCVTRKWAGLENVQEQKKLEARKMLVNRAESHLSGARGVRKTGRERGKLPARKMFGSGCS